MMEGYRTIMNKPYIKTDRQETYQNPLKNQQNLRLIVHGNQLTFWMPLLLGVKAYSIGMTSLAKWMDWILIPWVVVNTAHWGVLEVLLVWFGIQNGLNPQQNGNLRGSWLGKFPNFGGTTAKSSIQNKSWAEFTTSCFGGSVVAWTSRTSSQISKFRWKKCTDFAWIFNWCVVNRTCGFRSVQPSLWLIVVSVDSTAATNCSTGRTAWWSRLRLSTSGRLTLHSILFRSVCGFSSRSNGRKWTSKWIHWSVSLRQVVGCPWCSPSTSGG